jgi:allene oxide cyclase
MKAFIGLVAGAALAALAFGVVGTGATAGSDRDGDRSGRTFTVIEHATSDVISNPGTGGQADNLGDVLTFANEVFDRNDKQVVGHDQGSCVRVVVGAAWECAWTTFLAKGQITVEGPFYDAGDSELAVTGGTGAYARASGSMKLESRAGGTEFAFIFHLSD